MLTVPIQIATFSDADEFAGGKFTSGHYDYTATVDLGNGNTFVATEANGGITLVDPDHNVFAGHHPDRHHRALARMRATLASSPSRSWTSAARRSW